MNGVPLVQRRFCILALIMMYLQIVSAMRPSIKFSAKASRSDVNVPSDEGIGSINLACTCSAEGVHDNTTSNHVRDMITGRSNGSNRMELVPDVNIRGFLASIIGPISGPLAHLMKKDKTASEKARKIQQHHMAISEKVERFKKEFEGLKSQFPNNGQQLETHISNWKLVAGNLYTRKVKHLNGKQYSVSWKEEELPNDLWDVIYNKVATGWLLSFHDVVQAGVYEGQARLLMAHWSDLMMEFFLDLKGFELIPESTLSKSWSKATGQFVSCYLLGKFPPFDVATTYLNFDLKASILGDRHSKRLKMLSQEFDKATWRSIQFEFLRARLKHEAARDLSQEFDPIKEDFLKIGSREEGNEAFEIIQLIEDIMTYIPRANFLANQKKEKLVHYKVLYDMLRFIYCYNSELLSTDFKNSVTFHQFEVFEESTVLISSLQHINYELSRLTLEKIKLYKSPGKYLGHQITKSLQDASAKQQKYLPNIIKEELKGSMYLTDIKNPPTKISCIPYDDQDKENEYLYAEELESQINTISKCIVPSVRYQTLFKKTKDLVNLIAQSQIYGERYIVGSFNIQKKDRLNDGFFQEIEIFTEIGLEDYVKSQEKLENLYLNLGFLEM